MQINGLRQGLTNQQLELGMVEQDLHPTPLGHACAMKPFCSHRMEKYRRIDGACNNANNPSWGTPLSPYARILPPSYRDGNYFKLVCNAINCQFEKFAA